MKGTERRHERVSLFVQLDKNDKKPDWLPDTHIRCILGDFTVEQIVGAIKNKVQERVERYVDRMRSRR